jgi:hypothetical protein
MSRYKLYAASGVLQVTAANLYRLRFSLIICHHELQKQKYTELAITISVSRTQDEQNYNARFHR